jgi:hypothetical protein
MLLGRNGDVGSAADSRGVAGAGYVDGNGGTLQRTSSVAQPLSIYNVARLSPASLM